MAYNYYTPNFNAPQYFYPQSTPTAPATQSNAQSSIIWVQGEAGAKSYLVAPNTTVQLWDSEAQVIYLKSADASGMPSMKIIDYTIRDMSPANSKITQTTAYVTKDEFDAFKQEVQKAMGGMKYESSVSADEQQ